MTKKERRDIEIRQLEIALEHLDSYDDDEVDPCEYEDLLNRLVMLRKESDK